MGNMFCTLAEAAQRLETTEEELQRLLNQGLLREFRDGPHRLVKTTELCTVLAAVSARPMAEAEPSRPARPPRRANYPVSDNPGDTRLPRCAVATVKQPARSTTASRPRKARPQPQAPRSHVRAPAGRQKKVAKRPASASYSSMRPELSTSPPPLTLRQWIWNGLIQDRPLVIATLAGLLLMTLSAAVAGACLLLEKL